MKYKKYMIYNIRNYNYKTHPSEGKIISENLFIAKKEKCEADCPIISLLLTSASPSSSTPPSSQSTSSPSSSSWWSWSQDRVVTPLLLTERGDRTAPLRGAVHYTEVHYSISCNIKLYIVIVIVYIHFIILIIQYWDRDRTAPLREGQCIILKCTDTTLHHRTLNYMIVTLCTLHHTNYTVHCITRYWDRDRTSPLRGSVHYTEVQYTIVYDNKVLLYISALTLKYMTTRCCCCTEDVPNKCANTKENIIL